MQKARPLGHTTTDLERLRRGRLMNNALLAIGLAFGAVVSASVGLQLGEGRLTLSVLQAALLLEVSRVIGRVLSNTYKIVRPLGEGGMGMVYEATNIRLGKKMAIKVLTRLATAEDEIVHRFRREAQIASDLGVFKAEPKATAGADAAPKGEAGSVGAEASAGAAAQ